MTADELHQLLVAPELVVVNLLDHCLDALRLALLAEHPEFVLERRLAVMPHVDGTDGFFIARLRRS